MRNNQLQLVKRQIEQRRAFLNKRKTKRARPPKWLYPHNVERIYNRHLQNIVKIIRKNINGNLLPNLPNLIAQTKILRPDSFQIIDDSPARQVNELFNRIALQINQELPDEEKLAIEIGGIVSAHNKEQLQKIARAMFGVDVFVQEPWLENELNLFAANNVNLIKTIPQQSLHQIQEVVMSGLRQGISNTSITQQISQRYGITSRRAKLIARDQVGKLNGQLTKLRQQELGVDEYIWRNSQDERVRGNPDGLYPDARPSHWDREGKKYSWSKPPDGGNPGEPINCRCYAEPVLDHLI